MTMPVMEPDLDATVLQSWARAIDEGPFSSLCWGERIAFGNPDNLTLLGALAAWTKRVRLLTTVITVIMIGVLELLQFWAPGRHARLEGFIVDALTACAGLAVAAALDWAMQRLYQAKAGAA